MLRYKPRAFANSVPLRQAMANGSFPFSYIELFRHMRERFGKSEGARQIVDVLFLHRRFGAPVVLAAVEKALQSGAYDYNAVALHAHEVDAPRMPPAQMPQLRVLNNPDVPVPHGKEYDQLLAEVD